MTKEEFNHHKEYLSMHLRWDDLIRLCRNYEEECRQNGDLDNLAETLEYLYFELSMHGTEEEAKDVFDDLFALRQALAQHNFKEYGKDFAIMLYRKAYTTDLIEEAVACQEEAIGIYKKLGLYDEDGFDIDLEDAFGFLGQLYCYKGDYASSIHYTSIALKRALREGDDEFNIGLYLRRLGIAYLLSGNTQMARDSILKALDCFEYSNKTEPDPTTTPFVIDSCRQLLSECDGPQHPADYYWQWLI